MESETKELLDELDILDPRSISKRTAFAKVNGPFKKAKERKYDKQKRQEEALKAKLPIRVLVRVQIKDSGTWVPQFSPPLRIQVCPYMYVFMFKRQSYKKKSDTHKSILANTIINK